MASMTRTQPFGSPLLWYRLLYAGVQYVGVLALLHTGWAVARTPSPLPASCALLPLHVLVYVLHASVAIEQGVFSLSMWLVWIVWYCLADSILALPEECPAHLGWVTAMLRGYGRFMAIAPFACACLLPAAIRLCSLDSLFEVDVISRFTDVVSTCTDVVERIVRVLGSNGGANILRFMLDMRTGVEEAMRRRAQEQGGQEDVRDVGEHTDGHGQPRHSTMAVPSAEAERSSLTAGAGSVCSICREGMGSVSVPSSQLDCGHMFHLHCIQPWAQSHRTCPNCRAPMTTILL